ncbi:MAG: 2-oxoacid:acceptor oxidoreductase subunit alpha [Chloroflexi bacterium]|nr:2-oxoacid:acceptor oxidoreductase subunit alpha [Chloroflexota bacterium]
MSSGGYDFALAIGGAAGQGIATPGDILARVFVRRGLHLYTYNAFQSIVRGGHIFLTMRISENPIYTHGDKLDLLLCLNQDTMDRHLELMGTDTRIIYNSDLVNPGDALAGAELCPIPVDELTNAGRNPLVQNTVAIGSTAYLIGLSFEDLQEALTLRFQRQGQEVIDQNVNMAEIGFEYATGNFQAYDAKLGRGPKPLAVWAGNEAVAMGGAAAGVKFYSAYPMSPSTGVLHWMANNARDLDIMVRQVEDEIGVANMAIGAAHVGCRAMCATSGGGFALMTEAIGAASMMEIPVVFINVQRAGPSTGVPTKTEQGDLWQTLGASQGDFQRFIVAPLHAQDAFDTMPEIFNLTDKYQCPGIVLTDLLIGEGRFSFDPDEIDMHPKIDRGELITQASASGNGTGNGTEDYWRYKNTETGISPRALPGIEGYGHIVATDEHDEDSTLISDEFTNPIKRRAMVEKRDRKFKDIVSTIAAPQLEGPADADVTLIGWGSTYGVIKEAVDQLNSVGLTANHLPVKWIVPFHGDAIVDVISKAKKTILVENNYSGQFHRYMRGETGATVDGHIRKYDGEPFMPHHIVEGVREILAGKTDLYIPAHEIMV